jgi:GDPmannose 4,6-dehydratase
VRGETFVTRKITRAIARIVLGLQDTLYLGNLSALRDWGHARDYVEMQWLMLQQATPEDFVIASGEQHSVREFVERAARELGITIEFTGTGVDEIGIVSHIESESRRMTPSCKVGDVVIRVDPRYFRPTEVQTLLGDASRARERLGWSPRTSFEALVQEMAESDYLAARRDALVTLAGFKAFNHHE